MTLVNIISALGNNNSIYPLLVRDCGIENVAKCAMTYSQNVKESKFIAQQATRERIIDEYGTSAVWLGGIPLLGKMCDKVIDMIGLSSKVDTSLLKETTNQGLECNIEKFKNVAPKQVEDLLKVKNNKKLFQNAQVAKFLATTTIPIAIMGFVLPKVNFSYTNKKIQENKAQKPMFKAPSMVEFTSSLKRKNNQINFTGVEKLANMSDLNKMMILDGGLTVGRVKTGRNKAEKAELAFKMAGMCYLNYIAPKSIEKGLNALTKKLFNINTDLDVKLLDDKSFIKGIKDGALKLPDAVDEKTMLDFVDNNPTSIFAQQAKNLKIVEFLDNTVRDPRKFVDIEKLKNLKESIEEFASDAVKSGSVEKFAKNALRAKSFNTILNIATSSVLLALVLPKVQFLFRKLITGSDVDPAIKEMVKENK
ncbi:MAG: hypothetical protein IJW73_04415 [Candidatus Gastranaerophilales bacterium]|nr:hypothetical protein [Candidatus Gastranaerophilales bacterium]